MRIRKSGLIKRYSYPMCSRELITSTPTADNPWSNSTESYTFTRTKADTCTIQTPSYNTTLTLPEGLDLSQTYTIYTNTMLVPALTGSKRLADAIFLPSCYFGDGMPETFGGWFYVVKVKPHSSGVINHYEAVITRDTYLISEGGLDQYPDTTNLIASIPDKETLQSGSWLTSWESENITDDLIFNDQAFDFKENQKAGDTVATLVSSSDVGVIGYSFISGTTSPDGFFEVDNYGVVTITASGVHSDHNDYGQGLNTIEYLITATNSVGNEKSATVTLNTIDVNYTWTFNGLSYGVIPEAFIRVGGTITLDLVFPVHTVSASSFFFDSFAPRTFFLLSSTGAATFDDGSFTATLDGAPILNGEDYPQDGALHRMVFTVIQTASITTFGARDVLTGIMVAGASIRGVSATGITNTDVYPSGTFNYKLDEAYSDSHIAVDSDNGVIMDKFNDLPEDYSEEAL